MSKDQWNLLRQLPETIKSASNLPPGLYPAIATRLEEAIADGSRDSLLALHEQLAEFFKTYLQRSGGKVTGAVRGVADADADASAAYALGQISFAQLLAGQVGNRRVDERFATVIQENAEIVKSLLERDKTGLELAEATGLRPETISRKLKTLRELGILDYHRDGTSLFNFLTPTARVIASTLEETVRQDRRAGSAVRRSVASQQHKLRFHMRHAMTFAMSQHRDAGENDRVGARR